jgi:signal transduction histidine kinase
MLWSYCKAKLRGIGIFVLFALICTVVFSLYQLPLGAVGYAVLICAFFGLLFATFDYRAYVHRHESLRQVYRELTVTLSSLPQPRNQLEMDYQDDLWQLFREMQAMESDKTRRYEELVDYYTLWAHQIKTPIAALRLLMQEEDTQQSREEQEELQRIEQYVEMVLCYLRLDSNSSDYVIGEVELDGVVRQAVRKYASQFIRRKLKLVYEPVECRVLTDEKWLGFVIEQLLTNAIKYTRTGSITITLEENKTLCIADTGIGIAPSDLPRIFEKGFTGYNGRADKRASGIGLYLCRRILKKLGHTIEVTSAVGKGTQVRLHLDSAALEVE